MTQSHFQRFGEVSGDQKRYKIKECFNLELNPQSGAFGTANEITRGLVKRGWQYEFSVYRLSEMVRRKAGNCLGLSCFYGAILESNGFQPKYELLVGPKSFQGKDEQEVLDRLTFGEFFSFDQPILPESQEEFSDLYFATLGHPRLVLDGECFETTTLSEQGPSTIEAESVRELDYRALLGQVLWERAHAAKMVMNFSSASDLLNRTLDLDPSNKNVFFDRAMIAKEFFDYDEFVRLSNQYLAKIGFDSEHYLNCYDLTGQISDLDEVLQRNPTNMRAWPIKHVICEQDRRTRRVNFAVAAQCIARSQVISLGDFYAHYAHLLFDLFPNDAVDLLKKTRDTMTRKSEYHLAMAMIGCNPSFHFNVLLKKYPPQSPLQATRIYFAGRELTDHKDGWRELCCRFGENQIFRAIVECLEDRWCKLERV